MRNRMITVALVLAIALPVMAQDDLPFDPPRRHIERKQREEIREKMETMMIWKMTDELDLTEDQAARFFPMLKAHREQIDVLQEQRKELSDKLADLVWKTDVEKQEIYKLIDQLDTIEKQSLELRKKFRKDAEGVLEPNQVGKLVLFNQHFPQVMRDMIREHRERVPGPPRGPGPGPGNKSW